ncbi:DegT/DnrJ/EryC1/StrS family aminotransferase [bacterium]|nr:DegT/DnrJ/EryC1/StrS family aminotransferase [bacterium]
MAQDREETAPAHGPVYTFPRPRVRPLPAPVPFSSPNVGWFGYARRAMAAGLAAAGLKAGDGVLLPAYICRDLSDELSRAGFAVRFYRVTTGLRADLDHVRASIDEKTRALVAVHYFGFAFDLVDLAALALETGLVFVEDNTHGFLGTQNGKALGTFGDLGVFSFRKTFLIPNGAAAVTNRDDIRLSDLGPAPAAPRLLRLMWMLDEYFKRAPDKPHAPEDIARRAVNGAASRMEKRLAAGDALARFDPSAWSRLRHADFALTFETRRRNYYYLRDWMRAANDAQLIYDTLPGGVCPKALPVLVKDADKAMAELLKAGVPAQHWDRLPSEISGDDPAFGDARELRRRLVALPVNQYLRVAQREADFTPPADFRALVPLAYALGGDERDV